MSSIIEVISHIGGSPLMADINSWTSPSWIIRLFCICTTIFVASRTEETFVMTGFVDWIFYVYIFKILPSESQLIVEDVDNESFTAASKEILSWFLGGVANLVLSEILIFLSMPLDMLGSRFPIVPLPSLKKLLIGCGLYHSVFSR